MEEFGIKIDQKYLKELSFEFQKESQKLEKKILKLLK